MTRNDSIDQDFIDTLIEDRSRAKVFLSNGVRLKGYITKQDDNCFLLTMEETDDHQLVYKRMVATIGPEK